MAIFPPVAVIGTQNREVSAYPLFSIFLLGDSVPSLKSSGFWLSKPATHYVAANPNLLAKTSQTKPRGNGPIDACMRVQARGSLWLCGRP